MLKATGLMSVMALFAAHTGLFCANSYAHDHDARRAQAAASPAGKAASANVKLPDVGLTDQHGRTARFKSDVIGDRIVVLDNIYTSCTTICPIVTTIMVNVHDRISARAGKEVALVSVSVDPVTDTPQRLRAYARRHKATWNFWTGPKPAMDQVLKGLGIYSSDYTDHPSSIMVGDGRSGEWTRFYEFATPEQIVKKVDDLLAARRNTAVKSEAPQ